MPIGLSVPKNLLEVAGIRLATCRVGLYAKDREDLALIEIPEGASTAVMLTQNLFKAAPVVIASRHITHHSPRYLLINAGNANAGTGFQGEQDTLKACADLATHADCATETILPFSTGVIGEPLPVDLICAKLPTLMKSLSPGYWLEAAQAMMTTDTVPKAVSKRIKINDIDVTITGIAKGSGMIKPDMATMLAFIATDISVKDELMKTLLSAAVKESFNRICVDGETSTNDSCVLIATGALKSLRIEETDTAEYQHFLNALKEVCAILAEMIVRDGEGATKFITICVKNGKDQESCRKIAYTLAQSPLVKTAMYASDPNWGRILAAIGAAGVDDISIDKIVLYINTLCIFDRGQRSQAYTEEQGKHEMQKDELILKVDLGVGDTSACVLTCDLSHDYITINSDYRS